MQAGASFSRSRGVANRLKIDAKTISQEDFILKYTKNGRKRPKTVPREAKNSPTTIFIDFWPPTWGGNWRKFAKNRCLCGSWGQDGPQTPPRPPQVSPKTPQDRFWIDFAEILDSFCMVFALFFHRMLGRCFANFGPKTNHINQQRSKQTSQQTTNKPTNQQTNKQTNKQTDKPTLNPQPSTHQPMLQVLVSTLARWRGWPKAVG